MIVYSQQQFPLPTAEAVVGEARRLANFLIDCEGCKNIALCIHRVGWRYGIDPGTLHSLRYRWRELHDVKATTLERLRAAYEHVHECGRRVEIIERDIEELKQPREMELTE